MSNEKNTGLSLPDVNPGLGFLSGGSLVPTSGEAQTAGDRRGIAKQTDKQIAAIAAYRAKERYAKLLLVNMDQETSSKFFEIAKHLSKVNDGAKGKDYEQAVNEFNAYLHDVSVNQMIGLMNIAAYRIAEEVHKNVHPPKPEKPKGFFARLRGE